MSNQANTTALVSGKVAAPAVRDLDLGIVLINDTTVGTPWGSMRMHQRAPRSLQSNVARS